MYGELALFKPEDALSYDVMLGKKNAPPFLRIVFAKNFDSSKFPDLVSYAKNNIIDILNCNIDKDFTNGIIEFGIKNGAGDKIIRAETIRVCSSLTGPKGDEWHLNSSEAPIFINKICNIYHETKRISLVYEYVCLVEIIKKTGFDCEYDVLKGVVGKLLAEAMEGHPGFSTPATKRKMLKMYPQAKSRILENDLGL
jgi:hypothetical protein